MYVNCVENSTLLIYRMGSSYTGLIASPFLFIFPICFTEFTLFISHPSKSMFEIELLYQLNNPIYRSDRNLFLNLPVGRRQSAPFKG